MREEETMTNATQKDPPKPLSSADQEKIAPLDWRMDPEESYSDWKIEISVDGTFHESYHVHRNILAVGPR